MMIRLRKNFPRSPFPPPDLESNVKVKDCFGHRCYCVATSRSPLAGGSKRQVERESQPILRLAMIYKTFGTTDLSSWSS